MRSRQNPEMSGSTLSGDPAQENASEPSSTDGATSKLADGQDNAVDAAEKGLGNTAVDGPDAPEKPNGLQRTVTAQDWTGPDDPENPRNWPRWQRVYHTTVPALFCFAVTFGTSVYTPGYPAVAKEFNVSSTAALLPLSLYTLGLAFGPILAAPISETLGRRIVYLISALVSALFTLGAGFSHNFAALLITRFFAGFFGSPVLAVGGGTNVDIWAPVDLAASTAVFLFAPFLGPAIGPAVGGFAAQYKVS